MSTTRAPMPVLAAGAVLLAAASALLLSTCVPVTLPPPADPARAGLLLFNDPALSGSGAVACASCHPRGGHTDNKTYVGLDVVPDGQADGRSTPSLYGSRDTAPYSWAGGKSLRDNIKGIIVNRMKGKEPTGEQLDQLAAYIESLEPPPSPVLNADGSPSEAAPAAVRRGHAVFMRASCNACHVPPVFAKAENEDIGSGGAFNVPSLRGVSTTAPYFHDGRFPTLRALLPAKLKFLQGLGSTETFTDDEVEDLLAYLGTL